MNDKCALLLGKMKLETKQVKINNSLLESLGEFEGMTLFYFILPI